MPGRLGPSLIRSHCSGASGRERPWNALQRLKPPSVGQLYRSAAGAAPPKGRKLSAAYRLGTKPEWLRKETVRAEASPTLISCHCPITTEAARLPRFSEEPALSQAEGWATRASTPSHSAPSPLGAHPIEGPPPKRLIPDVRGSHPSQAQVRPLAWLRAGASKIAKHGAACTLMVLAKVRTGPALGRFFYKECVIIMMDFLY
jgi:hypothetical protein